MLAEAICKLEGFRYTPSETLYWQHGVSNETDYIYVTTQTLGREQLEHLNEEVGPHRSLLVLCCAFRSRDLADLGRLTVRKIPKAVLAKCEWGHDDYSLEIKNLPASIAKSEPQATPPAPDRATRKARAARDQKSLFDDQTS